MATTKTPTNTYEFKLVLSTKAAFSKATIKEACAGIAGAVRERSPYTLSKVSCKPVTEDKKPNGCCPRCGDTDPVYGSVQIEGDTAYQEAGCTSCDASWNEVYRNPVIEMTR